MDLFFFLNSILLGVGLAMDAFSVSVADALAEPKMRTRRKARIAGMFAGFQFLMPMLGWACVHAAARRFQVFARFTPWIALVLLGYIGGKMLREGIAKRKSVTQEGDMSAETAGQAPERELAAGIHRLSAGVLLLQGIATSIDALSVGFTIAAYGAGQAFVCALLIAVVTFAICVVGLRIGAHVGERLAGHAGIVGGAILIFIGAEIFVRGVLGV